ncbi:PREDICTED: transcription factor Ken-like isoform X2 [Vollenhovia emeryi]|uniref:transcription factor Ken-like isoform X2 n=1 Tax=Vollenhovia emeryi TaxID=411798 RepID=UPI0005F4087C|nr:PREDICTED: transcription factor Ken-like isoform X2 [Vollenhovia emeryi]
MEDDQQFCLRWNNHQSTLIQNFDTLLESGTLVDCTLAAEGKTLKAHKVVLSACSPYFECLLSEHYDKHPVFILKDVKFKELKAMMDYMYRGEVNISQDQLAALLKAAESLQIKGLSESKTAGSSKTESRPQKSVSQPTAPSLDIPHASSGLTIEKNKVPRQSLAQSSVGDMPEDSASPQVSKGLSSREGSQSPTSRKRKRFRRRSLTEDSTIENQDASNSSDMPQQMGVPALGIAPVADEKVHADTTDSLGRSALMTQLTKPADEMLQLPLEKPEPNDNLIEPKSEYLEDAEEGVEDLTLDEDMNDLNDMEQDNNRAGPSHDPAQHPGLGSWHVTGDRSNAGGVVGSAGATGTTDEVFLAAQEAAQAHRDSQGAGVVVCADNPGIIKQQQKDVGTNTSPILVVDATSRSTDSADPSSTAIRKIGSGQEDGTTAQQAQPSASSLTQSPSGAFTGGHLDSQQATQGQTGTSIPTNAKSMPELTGLIHQWFVPLLHAYKCRQRESQATHGMRQCMMDLPDCPMMQDFLDHLPRCQTGSNCTVPHCEFRTPVVRRYTCKYCNKSFTHKSQLFTHLRKNCYWNPSSMRCHVQESKPFSCSKCGASYSNQHSLIWHVRHDCELELGANNSTRGEGTKRKYSCKYCGKGFTQSGHLRSHQKSSCYWNPRSTCHQSQKIRPFSCTQCGACYSKQSHLIFHVRHECGRTQKCNICGKTFLHSSSLRRHRQRAPCNFQLC